MKMYAIKNENRNEIKILYCNGIDSHSNSRFDSPITMLLKPIDNSLLPENLL